MKKDNPALVPLFSLLFLFIVIAIARTLGLF